jgi:hypothetical protein
MSNRYKGAVISATPPTTTGGSSGTASGAWTLEQQMQLQAAGLWPAPPPPPNIEDVFSTYLYAGNGSTQGITNGINLSANGGLVWIKQRGAANHQLFDTVRGVSKTIIANDTGGQQTITPYGVVSFGTDGFTVRDLSNNSYQVNGNNTGQIFASWTFREQPKFFDIVTYTGNGTAGRTVAHNLGSVPGCIIVKRTDAANGWPVYHRSMNASPQNYMMRLNATTEAFTSSPSRWNDTSPTSTEFTLSANDEVNGSGATYVAYLFAHDAGGFGLTGTDNVISCGSFTTPSSGNATITLGYEPQWLMVKSSSNESDWYMVDTMRGFSQTLQKRLDANLSSAEETTTSPWFIPTATGFTASADSIGGSRTFIYIAIRRGPMATPTTGTSVFSTDISLDNANPSAVSGFVTDMIWTSFRNASNSYPFHFVTSRLINGTRYMETNSTNAEQDGSAFGSWDNMVGAGTDVLVSASVSNMAWMFKRAPGFFDMVCYTGNNANRTLAHNLGVAPELMIVKKRSSGSTSNWCVYAAPLANPDAFLFLNAIDGVNTASVLWNSTAPTSTVFSLGASTNINENGQTCVAHLFATLAGVSKVGLYTGTGALQTINCGFTTGARFVMIKRTNAEGSWYVWDAARGITSGNDPYITVNTTGPEVTNTNYVDTDPTGFKVTAAAPVEINSVSGTYIFLAIA